MDTALVVAIVAAIASFVGAGWAAKSAKRASTSAERTNSLNHEIAAIDQKSEELRLAYGRVLESMAAPTGGPVRGGERLAAIELLIVCRGADDRLKVAAGALHPFAADGELARLNEVMLELRDAYQESQRVLGLMRQFTLAGEDGRRELARAAMRDIRRNGPADVTAQGGPRPGQVGIVTARRRGNG